MDRQDYVIEVSHVSKSFKDNKVLKDVSLLCESGKIYGLVGHNGSGKTVLFKSICGFLSCDEGTITVNGKVMGKDKDMLTDAGIIIEDPGFLRTWSGYHNLEFLYTLRNKKNKDYLCSVLRKVGLDPALKRPVGKYSLGMRQRLALAQAIMEDPGILILDEPTAGMDYDSVEKFVQQIKKLKAKGKTILLITHDLYQIESFADYILLLNEGVFEEKISVNDMFMESLYEFPKEMVMSGAAKEQLFYKNDQTYVFSSPYAQKIIEQNGIRNPENFKRHKQVVDIFKRISFVEGDK